MASPDEIKDLIGKIRDEQERRKEKELSDDELEKMTGGRYFDTPEYKEEKIAEMQGVVGNVKGELSEDALNMIGDNTQLR